MYVCTLPCTVVRVKNCDQNNKNVMSCHVIVSKNSRIKTKTIFSLLQAKHLFYECSPFALTHAVRWWRHCCTAHAWWLVWRHPINKVRNFVILHRQCQFYKAYHECLSTYFRQIIVFVVDLDRVFAKSCEIAVCCHNSVSRNVTR